MFEDFSIHLINLPSSKIRLSMTLSHLNEEGFTKVNPFFAFDGKHMRLGLDRLPYRRENEFPDPRPGSIQIGIYLSHLCLWRCLSFLNKDKFLIFEDDVRFKPDWKTKWTESFDALPSDWDIIYLGSCCCKESEGIEQVSKSLFRVRTAQCLHAYAVRRSALNKMIYTCMSRIDAPIDIKLAMCVLPSMNVFAFLPAIATQENNSYPE